MSRVRFLAVAPNENIMILIDYTQIAIGSLMVALNRGQDLDKNLVRHITLNNLRFYRSKFKEECGELVICCDSAYFLIHKIDGKRNSMHGGGRILS